MLCVLTVVSIRLGKDFHVDPYFLMSKALSIAQHHRHTKKTIAIVTVKLTAID